MIPFLIIRINILFNNNEHFVSYNMILFECNINGLHRYTLSVDYNFLAHAFCEMYS